MGVEWQGDHKLLDAMGEKQNFEHELTRLGLDPDNFLVEVRRESDPPGVVRRDAVRYTIYITDLAHPDRDTLTLDGGHDRNWLAEFARVHRR